jgi:hypothetical protein
VKPTLRELQREFAAGVFEENTGVLTRLGEGRFGAARHLQVYRNNTFANLTDALAAIYPVVRRLVGEGFFEFAADRYIRMHPPRAGNLHEFGESFAMFFGSFEPASSLAYLPDVARLEWAWHEVFHAADHGAPDLARLAAVSESRYGELRFRLHPAARLISSPYPILRIWNVNQDGYHGDEQVGLDEGGVRLLVIRPALTVEIEALTPGDNALLRAFAGGASLAVAGEAALAADGNFDLPARLRHFVTRGALVDFTLAPATPRPGLTAPPNTQGGLP